MSNGELRHGVANNGMKCGSSEILMAASINQGVKGNIGGGSKT